MCQYILFAVHWCHSTNTNGGTNRRSTIGQTFGLRHTILINLTIYKTNFLVSKSNNESLINVLADDIHLSKVIKANITVEHPSPI